MPFKDSYDGLLVAIEGGVLNLTLNRPEQGNPISVDTIQDIADIFEAARAEPSVRCIVVRGNGPHLSAGGDITGFVKPLELSAEARGKMFHERLTRAARMIRAVLSFDRPMITIHRGAAAGGGLLFALGADITLADESATFILSQQRIGLPPDAGISFILPRVVGWRTARRLILTAARVDAHEAVAIGMIERITPTDQLEIEAAKLAAQFARAPQTAMIGAKHLLNGPQLAELDAQLAAEADAIALAVADPDFGEGVMAFLEKRRAAFPSAQT